MSSPLRATVAWDVPALRAGGSVALLFAIPFSVGARLAADADDSVLALWLTLGAVTGFLLGAGCAAWVQRVGTPLAHGMVTAVGTYVIAQAVFVAVRLARGNDIAWMAIAFNLSVVVFVGAIGGLLGHRLRRRGIVPSTERDQNGVA